LSFEWNSADDRVLLQDHPGKPKKDIYSALNLYRNCFKHVGQTDEKRLEDQLTLDQFNDTKNEYLLYVCVEDYVRLRKAMPIPMQIFQAWFCALHVELLDPQQQPERLLNLFPGIRKMSRAQQKTGAAACIARFSNNPQLLSHPDTEAVIVDR
jgi:hypothetical protein